MSRALRNSELKYNTMEKQAYALVKSLKHFKTYVGYSKIIAFVPHSTVKYILTQTDCLGTRARWVTKIQEYDLEIRPNKLVKGQDYFTKWVEAIPAKNATEKVIMDFIENNIVTRFGVPTNITTDNAKAFSSSEFSSFCFKYGIVLSHPSNYYPQGNGLAESSNKNLITIIKKIVGDNKRSWDSKIKYALWADRITKKKATSKSPFELVYGLDVTLPVHLKLPAYQLL
eukprot:PITA_27279